MAKNSLALAAGGIIAQVAFICIDVSIARSLGKESFGLFSTAFVISSIALIVVDLGMGMKLVKDGARDAIVISSLFSTTIILKFIFYVISYPIILIALWTLDYGNDFLEFFSVFYLFTLVMVLQESFGAVYSAKQQMGINALFQGTTPLVILLLLTLLFYFLEDSSLFDVAIAYVAGSSIVTICWFILISKSIRPKITLENPLETIKDSYLFGFIGLLSILFLKVDTLMLSYMEDMAAVGIYVAGYKLLDLAHKIPILVSRVIAPVMFNYKLTDKLKYKSITDSTLRGATICGIIASMIFYISAEPIIILIFGEQYETSVIILKILSGSFAIKFMSTILGVTLMTSDLQSYRVKALSIATISNVLLNLLLISVYGVIGAAVATIISELILLLLYAISVIRILGIVKVIVKTLVPISVAILIVSSITVVTTNLIFSSLISVSLFIVLVHLFKYITIDEIRFLVYLGKDNKEKSSKTSQ